MDYVIEPLKRTPIVANCDVLVAGGGIAGVSAALAAARQGSKVILCEREFMLGGLGTLGLVTIYLPLCDGLGNQVSFGIAEELLRLSIKRGAQARYPNAWLDGGTKQERVAQRFQVQYNPWLFACDLEQLLIDEGVEILYGTLVCDTVVQDARITGVVIENKSGRGAIGLKSCVDATGDADVCAFAGAETALFAPKNVLSSWYYFISQGEQKLKMLSCTDFMGTGQEANPLSVMRISGVDGKEISQMMMLSRQRMMEDILTYRRERDADMEPVAIPTIPEMRMTRRIVGLCDADIASERTHVSSSIGCISNWRKAGPAYEIPFACLYGRQIRNLITAGRCISVTDAIWDITRVIPPCAVTGQAAGIAAALTDDFEALDVGVLQGVLEEKGVVLHLRAIGE